MSGAARLVDLPLVRDDRGALGYAEEGGVVPFAIRRLFYLFEIRPGATRGRHAHRVQQQFLFMMAGACRLTTDDGSGAREWALEGPRQALYIPPMTWLELSDFTAGAICAVLASGPFDESDYVRDRATFDRLAAAARNR